MIKPGWVILTSSLLLCAGAASAHHSFAMFARDKEVTLSATVKEFNWASPHGWVRVVVAESDGRSAEWALETSAPNVLARKGWTRSSLKAGDKVSLKIHPLRDGSSGGQLTQVTFADGRVLGD